MIDLNKLPLFEWSDLYWLEFEVKNNFKSLYRAIIDHENIVIDRERELKGAIKEDVFLNSEGLSDEEFGQYYSHYYEHEDIAIKEIKGVFSNSLLLMSFSIFEGKLKQLCELIQERIGSTLGHDDLKSNDGDIGRFKKYLTAVFGLSLDQIENEFKIIGLNKIVRNKIAHENGLISEGLEKKIKAIEGIKIQQIGENRQILINDTEYLRDVVKSMEVVFEKLLLLVDHQLKNSNHS